MGGKTILNEVPSEITIAKWRDRFLAWIIDFAVVSSVLGVFYVVSHSTSLDYSWHALDGLAFLGYWSILEYKYGQSLGKRVLDLRITYTDGTPLDLKDVLMNSFGKAFLLPIDVILGLILTNKKRQRIFNKLSDTIVIKLDQKEKNIPYRLD